MKNVEKLLLCICIILVGSLSVWSQKNVLLIGNSQLGVYDGLSGDRIYTLSQMITEISESAPIDFPRIDITQKMIGGASLKSLWELGEGLDTPRDMIARGNWDIVIIQEIFNAEIPEFENYAAKFDELIQKSGAKTILFATAGVTKHYSSSSPPYPDGFNILNGMQVSFAKTRGITVAAAGYAWMKYLGPHPSEEQLLDLYHKDKGHPGYKGSYIYACLLYAVITGKSPMGLSSEFITDLKTKDSNTIEKEEAAMMQKAAWEQYKEKSKN